MQISKPSSRYRVNDRSGLCSRFFAVGRFAMQHPFITVLQIYSVRFWFQYMRRFSRDGWIGKCNLFNHMTGEWYIPGTELQRSAMAARSEKEGKKHTQDEKKCGKWNIYGASTNTTRIHQNSNHLGAKLIHNFRRTPPLSHSPLLSPCSFPDRNRDENDWGTEKWSTHCIFWEFCLIVACRTHFADLSLVIDDIQSNRNNYVHDAGNWTRMWRKPNANVRRIDVSMSIVMDLWAQ